MKKLQGTELKVGLFALGIILIIVYATVLVSQEGSIFSTGTYQVFAVMESAEGLTPKTPIEIAGIQVGTLGKSQLVDNRAAKVVLNIKKGVKLSKDVIAQVRTKGFLGESYIDLKQGDAKKGFLEPGDTIEATNPFADLSQLSGKLNEIADDVSEMTSSVKSLFKAPDDKTQAPVTQMILNMRDFTKDLKEFSQHNKGDMNRVVANLAALTQQLRIMVEQNRGELTNSMQHIRSIAQKIDEGRGTIGRLVNDETTIDELNKAVANLNETIGGFAGFELNMGYHLEYLARSESFKNYVTFGLRTRPDRAFLFELVADSTPSPDRELIVTDVTTGGTTTTVTTEREITKRDQFRFSAQIAQDFHDFTVRGGLIESRAGVGLDYSKKFFKASVSAWDFNFDNERRPHIKAWGTVNLTRNFFVLGGIDDPLNPAIPTDWFVGAGFQFVDNDVKSLLGLGAAAAK